ERNLGHQFEFKIVTRQKVPEPSFLSHCYRVFTTCLFRRADIIHTFDIVSALLVLLRRFWDAGPRWVHSPQTSKSRLSHWFQNKVLPQICDTILYPAEPATGFAEALTSADTDIAKLGQVYKSHARIGIVVISPLVTHENTSVQDQIFS